MNCPEHESAQEHTFATCHFQTAETVQNLSKWIILSIQTPFTKTVIKSSYARTLLSTSEVRCSRQGCAVPEPIRFLRLLQKGLLPFLKSSAVVVFLVVVSAPLFRPSFFARDRKYYVALNKWVIRGNICLCTSATVLKASETQVKYLREQATALLLAIPLFAPPSSPLFLCLIPSGCPR